MEFEKLLRLMVEKGGSDLFITPGLPPSLKVNGQIVPVTRTPLTQEQKEGAISYRDALAYADSANDLRLMIKLEKGASGKEADNLSLGPV